MNCLYDYKVCILLLAKCKPTQSNEQCQWLIEGHCGSDKTRFICQLIAPLNQLSYFGNIHFQIELLSQGFLIPLHAYPTATNTIYSCDPMCQTSEISSLFGTLGHKQSRWCDFRTYPKFPEPYLKWSIISWLYMTC